MRGPDPAQRLRRRTRAVISTAAAAATILATPLWLAEPAAAHGTWYAAADAPYVSDGFFWGPGRSYSSEQHRKQCITVWLQEWDDGMYADAGSSGSCRYDHAGTLSEKDGTACGWSWTTITETFRTKTVAEFYNAYGDLVHRDVRYSNEKTLSC